MSQLYKMSYAGQNKINFSTTGTSRQRNRLSSREGNMLKRDAVYLSKQGKSQYEAPVENIKFKQPKQGIKKLDIDPSNLLFSRTKNVRAASQQQKRILQSNNQSEQFNNNSYIFDIKEQQRAFFETAKQGFNYNQQRPQSKQQPRSKLSSRVSLRNQFIAESNEQIPQIKKRPDTSKGLRTIKSFDNSEQDVKKRKMSLQNVQEDLSPIPTKILKRSNQHPLSATVRKKSETEQNKIKFQTALDPQFLALFAN